MRRIQAAVAMVVMLLCGVAAVADSVSAKYATSESVPKILLAGFGKARIREQYLSLYIDDLLQVSVKGDPITLEDLDTYAERMKIGLQQEKYSGVISYDLDFDGNVTVGEIVRVARLDVNYNNDEAEIARSVKYVLDKYDDNSDGIVSLPEMSSLKPDAVIDVTKRINRLRALFAIDPDQDGRLTITDIDAVARKAFATFDADQNDVIGEKEMPDIAHPDGDF